MSRDEMIQRIRDISPAVTQVTETLDMGYEFSAVLPDGVIYAEPGMLLDYSGGDWPPFNWVNKTDMEFSRQMFSFLLNGSWRVVPWCEIADNEIAGWLEMASETPFRNYRSRL